MQELKSKVCVSEHALRAGTEVGTSLTVQTQLQRFYWSWLNTRLPHKDQPTKQRRVVAKCN